MIPQLNTFKKIIFIIFIIGLAGCAKSLPLAFQKPKVNLEKSEVQWSKDYGPEMAGYFRSIATADFNKDGNLDIVGGSIEQGSIFLWYGDGLGNWERKQRFPIKADILSLAVGDIDNDGWIDILSSSIGDSEGIQVWINKNGLFEFGRPVTERNRYEDLKLVDINNDSNLDLIAANNTSVESGGIRAWFGNGKGDFFGETGPTRKRMYRNIAIADFNHDGKLDIVGAGWFKGGGALNIWLGTGDGRWSGLEPPVEKGPVWGVTVSDINNDGNVDIVAATNFAGVKVFYGDGSGEFPEKEVLTSKGSFWMAKAIDIDNNGLMDIVAASNNNNGMIIWYQKGKGNWVVKNEGLPVEGFYFDFEAVDFNHDGKIDLASTTYGEGIKAWFGGAYKPSLPKKTKKIVKKLVDKQIIFNKRPLSKRIIEKEKKIIPEIDTSVFFDTLSAELKPKSKVVLSKVAELLKKFKNITVKVEGHADPRKIIAKKNKFSDNQTLSLARANAVANFLISSDIDEKRIKVFAYGTDKSISYQKQRRVDIKQYRREQREIDEKKTGVNKKALSEKIIERERIVIPEISTSIFFDSNTADLRPETIIILGKVVEYLKKFKNITVKVEGHANARSTIAKKSSENQALAMTRAKEVANILISSGINKERIKVSAHEDAEPDNSADDPVFFQIHRRVDVITSKIEVINIVQDDEKNDSDRDMIISILEENAPQAENKFEDPFKESGDIIPATEYKSFKMINNIPEYRIGSGDVLEVTIWEGIIEKQHLVKVTPKGTVTFSFFTNFEIKGLTPTEAEKEFSELLKEVIVTPKIKVIVNKKLAHTVSIFGAVSSPGTFVLLGQERLTQFLSRSRVNLRDADLTRVQLTRAGRTYFLNISDALFKGDFRQDEFIDSGDVIFVPSKRKILKKLFVMGEVAKPGMFIYEGQLTLLEAITQAGGPTFYGKTSDVIIIRGDEAKPEGIRVNFDDIVKKGDFSKNVLLQQGDIVYIAKNTVGNIQNFISKLSPFIAMAKLPMEIYGATAIPYWEGFPLYRETVPTTSTVIQSPSVTLPDSAGKWQIIRIK